MHNNECDSTDFDELSRIELAEVSMQSSNAIFLVETPVGQMSGNAWDATKANLKHGDTEAQRRKKIEPQKNSIDEPLPKILSVFI